MMVQGQCVVKVISIATNTEMGRIGKALGDITTEKTTLQKQVKKIVIGAFIIAVLLCTTIVLAYGFINKDWIQGLLS